MMNTPSGDLRKFYGQLTLLLYRALHNLLHLLRYYVNVSHEKQSLDNGNRKPRLQFWGADCQTEQEKTGTDSPNPGTPTRFCPAEHSGRCGQAPDGPGHGFAYCPESGVWQLPGIQGVFA